MNGKYPDLTERKRKKERHKDKVNALKMTPQMGNIKSVNGTLTLWFFVLLVLLFTLKYWNKKWQKLKSNILKKLAKLQVTQK